MIQKISERKLTNATCTFARNRNLLFTCRSQAHKFTHYKWCRIEFSSIWCKLAREKTSHILCRKRFEFIDFRLVDAYFIPNQSNVPSRFGHRRNGAAQLAFTRGKKSSNMHTGDALNCMIAHSLHVKRASEDRFTLGKVSIPPPTNKRELLCRLESTMLNRLH